MLLRIFSIRGCFAIFLCSRSLSRSFELHFHNKQGPNPSSSSGGCGLDKSLTFFTRWLLRIFSVAFCLGCLFEAHVTSWLFTVAFSWRERRPRAPHYSRGQTNFFHVANCLFTLASSRRRKSTNTSRSEESEELVQLPHRARTDLVRAFIVFSSSCRKLVIHSDLHMMKRKKRAHDSSR